MKMRGRNRKWLGTGSWWTVRKIGLVVVFEFCAWVGECSRKGNALVIVDVIELGV